VDVAAAFGVSTVTVWRWQSDYDEAGVAGVAPAKPGPKGAWKVTDEVAGRIVELRGQGRSQQEVADAVGVSRFSVRRVLADAAADAGDQGEGHGEPAGVARPSPRTAERQAARFGQIEAAAPVFTEGRDLPLVGLLVALPALEATGLLEVAESVYGRLKNGFYGLRSTLLTLVFLALLREPRAEGATRIEPGDLGRVLALDRAPEVSTIRRKLVELAEADKAGQLMGGLARRHVEGHPEAVGFLYVDGHVRTYHGTRRLPKAHVARMRIAMPATLETWVCDQNGDPVFAVVAPPSASTVAEVRRLLPELRTLVGDRRTTIVFDRGGRSGAG
jgi:prepilin-type processing-associated H-X9-DG protein